MSEIGGRLVSKLSKDHLGWLEVFWKLKKRLARFNLSPSTSLCSCADGMWRIYITLSTKSAKHDPVPNLNHPTYRWVAHLHASFSISQRIKNIHIFTSKNTTIEVYTSLGRIGLYHSCTCYKALHFFGAWHVQKEPRSLGPGAELLLVSLGHRHCQCIWATWGRWSQGIRRVARIFDKGVICFIQGSNKYIWWCCGGFMLVLWRLHGGS